MRVGCMLWRIGGILDLGEQLEWCASHGFEAIAFWTCSGTPGVWQGFDVGGAKQEAVDNLMRALGSFDVVDLHAHRYLPVGPVDDREEALGELHDVVRFAGTIGADTVTAHLADEGAIRSEGRGQLPADLDRLNEWATAANVRIGMEVTGHYALGMRREAPRVGLTLDVGHVSFAGGAGYQRFGSVAGLIRHLGDSLFHVHVHDYDGEADHLPVGNGRLDFAGIVAGLAATGYRGVLCLELDPGRASPDDLLRSRATLAHLVSQHS